MKTFTTDIYATYTTTLVNEGRTEKRAWEGMDFFAEVAFVRGALMKPADPVAVL